MADLPLWIAIPTGIGVVAIPFCVYAINRVLRGLAEDRARQPTSAPPVLGSWPVSTRRWQEEEHWDE